MVAETDRSDELASEPGAAGGARVSAWKFRIAVVRHHRLVYRFARSLLQDGAEAEDVTQETFLRYWQQGAGVQGPKEWLLTVARNICLDRLRRTRRTVFTEDAALPERGDDREPLWHLEQGELASRLRRAIATLSEPQRSLVVLFDVHGLDGASCARILGINTTQVRVYLHRARRRLRRELEETQ
jgi:RNA polymerase sigma-70 factor (ECF subfamily)